MRDSGREFAIHLGRAQIDAMFTRQAAAPLDDSEFLPLLEAMLTAYEKILPDAIVTDQLWEYAFGVYDRLCREAQPAWTAADSRKLMRSYLLGKRGDKRRHRE